MIDQPATEQTPEQRLEAAYTAFLALNRVLPQGMPPFQIPPTIGMAARLNALLVLLVEKGVLTETEITERSMINEAKQIEEITAIARELKLQATGFAVAQPGQRV